jgi:chromosome segregation ATPase
LAIENSDLDSVDDLYENQEDSKDFKRPSDLRKRAKHFEKSRDEWKKRNAEKRREKQVLMTKTSRLEQRLKQQEENNLAFEKKLKKAEAQIKKLEDENEKKDNEIEILKKKLTR